MFVLTAQNMTSFFSRSFCQSVQREIHISICSQSEEEEGRKAQVSRHCQDGHGHDGNGHDGYGLDGHGLGSFTVVHYKVMIQHDYLQVRAKEDEISLKRDRA